jgi:hypothetical protein
VQPLHSAPGGGILGLGHPNGQRAPLSSRANGAAAGSGPLSARNSGLDDDEKAAGAKPGQPRYTYN